MFKLLINDNDNYFIVLKNDLKVASFSKKNYTTESIINFLKNDIELQFTIII